MARPKRSAGWVEGDEPTKLSNMVVTISIVTALGLPFVGTAVLNNHMDENTETLQAVPSEPVVPEPSPSETPSGPVILNAFTPSPKPTATPTPKATPKPKSTPKPTPGPVPAGLSGASASVKKIAVTAEQLFPAAGPYGGYRPADAYGEHSTGRAIDIMVPNKTVGQAVADYFQAHAKEYNIKHIIWNQHIWSVARSSEGWRPMEDRGDPTQNHEDHAHILTN